LSWIILAGVSLPFYGGYAWLHLQKSAHRREMRRIVRSEEQDATTLVFHVNRVPEMEERGEFSWQGDRYDVIDLQTIGDSIHIRCYKDEKEESLNEQIAGFFHTASSSFSQTKVSHQNWKVWDHPDKLLQLTEPAAGNEYAIVWDSVIPCIQPSPPDPPPPVC